LASRNLADVQRKGNLADPAVAQREAVEAFRTASKIRPRSGEFRGLLVVSLARLGEFERLAGNWNAAMAAAEEKLTLADDNANRLYNAARDFAQIAAAPPTAALEDAIRTRAADVATTTLRRAIERGFADSRRLGGDAAFDGLRQRPDFPKLAEPAKKPSQTKEVRPTAGAP
jgi:hypothetical protein